MHPLLVAFLFFALFMLSVCAVFYADSIKYIWSNFEFFVFFGLSIPYVIYVTHRINKVHIKDFYKLLDYSDLDSDRKSYWQQRLADHRSLWKESLVAVAVALLHAYLQGLFRLFEGQSRFFWLDVLGIVQLVVIWVLITQSNSIFIRNMTEMNKLSKEIRIDLLNLEKFMPLTRAGVWSILGFIGVYTILFNESIEDVDLINPAVLVIIPTIFWMIYIPLKGFRKRVIQEKDKEIALIEASIEGDREKLKESRIRKNLENINVIDLINYKKLIQNTFEIPVNIPTAFRFVFYLIIPLLTWIAASMVDKVVDYLVK